MIHLYHSTNRIVLNRIFLVPIASRFWQSMRIIKFIHAYVHCRTDKTWRQRNIKDFASLVTFHIYGRLYQRFTFTHILITFFHILQTVPGLTRYLSVSNITFMSTMDSAKCCVFYLALVAKQIAIATFKNTILDVVTNV